jgi:hypothetical protein
MCKTPSAFSTTHGGSRRACRTPRAPYDLWNEQGFLETTPGASISYEFIAERLKDVFEEYHATKIAFDRWSYLLERLRVVSAGRPGEPVRRLCEHLGRHRLGQVKRRRDALRIGLTVGRRRQAEGTKNVALGVILPCLPHHVERQERRPTPHRSSNRRRAFRARERDGHDKWQDFGRES